MSEENTTPSVTPIVLTDNESGETWTFDFNRLAIQRIVAKPELVRALDITEDCGAGTRLAMWGLYMPQIMSIATIMNHSLNALPVTKAEALYARIPRKAEFCAKLAEIFLTRTSELNGFGNEDVVEDNAGNVSWE